MLILGGTGEAMTLAAALRDDARYAATYSLAGATRTPALPGIARRIGGFGGASGLAAWLREQAIAALVDATHPYAVRISANAVAAAATTAIPLLRIGRPPWSAQPGDRWIAVEDPAAAAAALGDTPRRVLLTIGSKTLAAFREAAQHCYWVRCIDPPEPGLLPPGATLLLARPPFALADERALLARHGIDIVVTKNSGGDATAPKLQAAREAGIEVVMIRRPDAAHAPATVPDAAAALRWLAGLSHSPATPRGA